MGKMKTFVNTLAKSKDSIWSIWDPIEIAMVRKNQFRILRSLKLGKNG